MHWFSQISGRKSFKSSAPAIVLAEQNGKQLQFTKGALNTAYKYLPPEPIPLTGDNDITIKSMRGAPVKVNECLSLFVTTWNLAGSISVPESDSEISCWIPKGHGLYAISLQDCRKPDQLEAAILKYLGGNTAYQKYKTKEIAGTTLLVFVDQMLNRTGVFKMNHINGLTKHEVKTGKLGGSSNGRGAVCMRFTFHNTVIAFIACKLDSKSPEKREADLEFILKDTGVDTPEVQEIGTPALAKVHHVFLFGDFGTRILYPPKSSLKSLVPHVSNPDSPWDPARWENLLQYDELDELQVKNVCFSGFREPVINYPPTGWRRKWDDASTKSKSSRNGKATSVSGSRASAASGVDEEPLRGAPRIASLFEANFNLDDLFDLKSGGAHTLPTYSDRIFFRTLKDFQHLISFGTSGTAEGMIYAAHVPVFATFKINGVDKTLLHSWQKITGNIPPEYATRADRHLVAGVVAQVQEIVQGQIAAAAAAAAEAEAEAEEMKTAPKCAMCNLPCLRKDTKVLDLPGGKKAHADCFKCETCGKSLVGEKFYNVENRWLCENDFSQSYTKSCPQCGKPVTSQFLRIGNNQFHIECFTCSKAGCGKKLVKQDTGEFEPFDELGGKPYCMEHYKEQTSLLTFCAACNRIILEGEAAVPHVRKTMNGEETSYFHESCFHCKVCHEDLGRSEKKFVISDGEMYCEPDFINLFGPLPKPPTTNSPTASTLPPATEVAAAE